MATDVIMPALGVAQEKGTLLNWLKAEGQPVTKGEPLMEVETDKATVEIEAPASGILANVIASPGDEVPVGNRIAVILAPGETATPTAAQDPHPFPKEREQIKVALCLNGRKQVRVALGLRHPRRQPNPRLQRRRMADVFLRRPQQSGLPEKKESISERYMGAVPRKHFSRRCSSRCARRNIVTR